MSSSTPADDQQGGEEESVSWGLGYHGSVHVQVDDDSICHSKTLTIDEMMKHYMQQCLEFHFEQEAKRSQEATASTLQAQQQQSFPHFVQGMSQQPSGTSSDTCMDSKEGQSIAAQNTTGELDKKKKNQSHTQEQVEAARAKAQAILERFQLQQEKFLSQPSGSTADICTQNYTTSDTPPGFFAQQRQRALLREQERKLAFWEKNCQYAIAREQDRLAQQAQQLQQTTAWHEKYQAALQERQTARYKQQKLARSKAVTIAQSKEGIGTVNRHKLDRKQQQQQQQQQTTGRTGQTVAVYVSGFPTDASINEDFARALFGSYGTIRKVHFYRNKATGQLKGDALVIYDLSAHQSDEDTAVLLTTVCQQMNGAELPGGYSLSVEPANSIQNREKTAATIATPDTSNTSLLPDKLAAANAPPNHDTVLPLPNGSADANNNLSSKDNDDNDLDDFFSSL